MSKVICAKAITCQNKVFCDHWEPHEHVGAECDIGASKSCWYCSCIPVPVGEWKVKPIDKHWLVRMEGVKSFLWPDGNVHDCWARDAPKALHPTQQAAQAALDKYLNKENEVKTEKPEQIKWITKEPIERNPMFKKALHRIVVVWCLYGLAKLCIFVNPLMFGVWAMALPKDDPPILGDGGHTFTLWVGTIIVFAALALAASGIHYFSNWFFNTSKK